MAEHAWNEGVDFEESRDHSQGSGVYERRRTPGEPVDRARVVLCVLGMSNPRIERAASELLPRMPWTDAARELATRLLGSEDHEAAARAAVALARNDGKRALRDVARHVSKRVSKGTVGTTEARLLGAALGATNRNRALDLARAQVAKAATEEDRALWRQIAIGIARS